MINSQGEIKTWQTKEEEKWYIGWSIFNQFQGLKRISIQKETE